MNYLDILSVRGGIHGKLGGLKLKIVEQKSKNPSDRLGAPRLPKRLLTDSVCLALAHRASHTDLRTLSIRRAMALHVSQRAKTPW